MPETPQKFYLTTPIYYVNARPHIGHAYTTIVADVLARRARAQGTDTWFLTGTDEHGQKIERSAAAAGIPPQQFADQISEQFQNLWDRMGLTYNQFIRTTDPAHKRGVQKLFTTLQQNGHIYLDSYTGAYCVSDETFVDVPTGAPCPDCGRPTETVTEENYFFRLSAFQETLIDLIVSGEFLVEPFPSRNEILSFLAGDYSRFIREYFQSHPEAANKIPSDTAAAVEWCIAHGYIKRSRHENFLFVPGALRDLSISRSSFKWGIPVPGDEKHVIYVWLDALANYLTAVGYGSEDPADQVNFKQYWPADLHIVGKEIIRFHCVYWPAFLLAANLPLPKKIVAHGWLLFDDAKMSKSKGNIVRTETILEAFGTLCPPPQLTFPNLLSSRSEAEGSASALGTPTPHHRDLFAADVLRYFLLREIPFGQDGSFSFEALITRYNADLANGYGNLVSRTLKMISTFCSSQIPAKATGDLRDKFEAFLELPQNLDGPLYKLYVKFDFLRDLEVLAGLVSATDASLDKARPWKIVKDVQILYNKGELTDETKHQAQAGIDAALYIAAEAIRIITILLNPVLPYATACVWRQLGLDPAELTTYHSPLTTLTWGGLQPGTKLGPLSPIFPRADKGLAQLMANMESLPPITTQQDATTPLQSEFAEAPIASQSVSSVKSVLSLSADPTDPAAPPRTATFAEPNPGLQVAGSTAATTERPGTPSHTEAASGIFNNKTRAPFIAEPHPATSGSTPEPSSPPDASPQITIEDFARIELRIAQIVLAERIPKADKLLRLEVDLGYERRQILSGIAEWYTPEDLLGRRIVVITNLAPRKMRGLESHGMLLAASGPEGGKPHLATIDSPDLPLGSRLK